MRSVRDAQLEGKRVLLRVDMNVPLKDGKVADDTRIKAALPTLEFIHGRGAASITLLTHLGRPEGKVVESLRVAPVEARVRELTHIPFTMHENLRFDAREEANDPSFAKELATLGDLYVNDAFADAHRAHASIVGVASLLPSYAGLLIEEEVKQLSSALTPPEGALAVIGGAKFETKIPLLTKLSSLYSHVLLGGALANDFLKARGSPVADSLVSDTPVPEELAGNMNIEIPTDGIFKTKEGMSRPSNVNDIRVGEGMVDIGPTTAVVWQEQVRKAPLVLWNGPVGLYEGGFNAGTDALAKAISESAGRAVIGGGDTNAALQKFSFDPARVFVSTGGGAMLEFLANGTLPGVEALRH